MTEKRFRTGKGIFQEGYPSETIIDNKTGKTYYNGYAHYNSSKEMCELLNKLIEENEHLKHEINYLENRLDDCVCLKKENKDLKEENLELSQKILKGLFEDENDELRRENKKLKEELKWYRMTVDGLKG